MPIRTKSWLFHFVQKKCLGSPATSFSQSLQNIRKMCISTWDRTVIDLDVSSNPNHKLKKSNPSDSAINSCVIPNSLEDLGRLLYRNPPQLCLLCARDTSATLSAVCTGTLRSGTLRNFGCYLHPNPPKFHQPSAPEPAGTSSAKRSGTSSPICTGTLRNLIF